MITISNKGGKIDSGSWELIETHRIDRNYQESVAGIWMKKRILQ